MKQKIIKYTVLVTKAVIVTGGYLFIGYLTLNHVFRLSAGWAYSILFVLCALLVGNIIISSFSGINIWERAKNTRTKILAISFLIIFLIIAYLPESLGINEGWIKGLFFMFALLAVIPFWLIEKTSVISK